MTLQRWADKDGLRLGEKTYNARYAAKVAEKGNYGHHAKPPSSQRKTYYYWPLANANRFLFWNPVDSEKETISS